jgi:hypothetical protein
MGVMRPLGLRQQARVRAVKAKQEFEATITVATSIAHG